MVDLPSAGESARALLIRRADIYFWWLIASTVVLFVGAIMEEANPFEWLKKSSINIGGGVRASQRWRRSTISYKHLAVIMVVIGIGGEGAFEYLVAHAESAVRELDNRSTREARNEAATALFRAESGEKAASARLEEAKREIDAARLALALQGPRWLLLENGKDAFVKALKPFAGSAIIVLKCGSWGGRTQSLSGLSKTS